MQTLRELGRPLVEPIATAGLVLVFVIFMLLQREDLRDRIIRLVGSGDVARTTEAMNDAAKRISRYLLMQLVINVLYGLPVGVGLYLIGVPNPILWGLLATILRFIPYVGPMIAALFPIALSFAVAPGWTLPLLTIALFVTLELFSNNILEPWLYGVEHGAVAGRGAGRRRGLDHALGAGRAAALDARSPCASWCSAGMCRSSRSSTCCWVTSRRCRPRSSSTSACSRATRTRRPSWPRSTWRTSRSRSSTTA